MDSTMQDAFSDDEDLYGNSESTQTKPTEQILEDASGQTTGTPQPAQPTPGTQLEQSDESSNDQAAEKAEDDDKEGGQTAGNDEEEEEEEDEEEESDSDIEFVIERKDGSRPEPPSQPNRYNSVRMSSAQPPGQHAQPVQATKIATPTLGSATAASIQQPSGTQRAESPPPKQSTSKIDVNAVPQVGGRPLTELSLETDIPNSDTKPWRKPGADQTDYFNYGFDEFTWSAYCLKQQGLRQEYDTSKMWQEMSAMMTAGFPGMPGMIPDAAVAGMVPPDMQAMMAAAAAAGFPDPTTAGMFMGGPPGPPGPAVGPAQMAQGRPQTNAGFDGSTQGFSNQAAPTQPAGPQAQNAQNMGPQTQPHTQQPPQQPRIPPQGPAALQQQQHHHQPGMPPYGPGGFDGAGMMPGPGMGPGGVQGGMPPQRPMGTGYGPNRGGARNVRPGATGGAAYQGLPY